MNEKRSKVIIIGLDGATFDLIGPWVKKGLLPNISKLMKKGSYGYLKSVRPHCTAPAWTSFATGKNPGKHGVFDFVMPSGSLSDLETVTSDSIKSETFYEIVENAGMNCALINLPVSYPPRIKGITITSLMTKGEDFVFPSELKNKLTKLNEYRISPDPEISVKGRNSKYIRDIRKLERTRFECVKDIFELKDWDCFFYLISGSDWIQHRTFGDLLSGNSKQNSEPLKAFKEFDEYIGWFVENLPQNTNLLLMSDHGFMIRPYIFYINTWLKKCGYLSITKGEASRIAPTIKAKERQSVRRGLDFVPSEKLIKLLHKFPWLKNSAIIGFRTLKKFLPIDKTLAIGTANLDATSVFNTREGTWGVYINDSKRFLNGTVDEETYPEIRNEIKEKLVKLRNPYTGKKVLKNVQFSEDVYSGPYTRKAPDVVFQSDFHQIDSIITHDVYTFRKGNHNGHSPLGILISYGPDIKKATKIRSTSLLDLAPTILHILNLPVVDDMDGNVIKDIFHKRSKILKREVKYKKPDDRYSPQTQKQQYQADNEQEQVKERLRNLGYLD